MITPYPTLSKKDLDSLEKNLIAQNEAMSRQLEAVQQQLRFLEATQLYLKLAEFKEKKYDLLLEYDYDATSNERCFRGLTLEDAGQNMHKLKDIKTNYLYDNFEELIYETKLTFFNDSDGRFRLLSKILGEEYILWQQMHMDDTLAKPAHRFFGPKI